MVNPEHVEVVRRGNKAIEEWRTKHPGIRFDLSNANLSGISFAGADLNGADLSEAMLHGVILYKVNLYEANLRRARLSEANLIGTNLSNADLSRTNLIKATLREVNLSGADFNEATMGSTLFGDCDLSTAKNLDKANHSSPSTVGIDTIYRSGGKIPEEFLLGAGVPQRFIDYLGVLIESNPIQFYSCFISYSIQDEEFVLKLYRDLTSAGIRCWLFQNAITPGQSVWGSIDEGIKASDKLLVVLSKNSVKSRAVKREIEATLEIEQETGRSILVPISIDNAVFANLESIIKNPLMARVIGDFSEWKNEGTYRRALSRLLKALTLSAAIEEPKGR